MYIVLPNRWKVYDAVDYTHRSLKMAAKIVVNKKNVMEIEFSNDNKEVPVLLRSVLAEMGIDCYTLNPHPLTPKHFLHVECEDPKNKVIEAIDKVKKDWKQFESELV